jgi:predicted HTH domain antitoxin
MVRRYVTVTEKQIIADRAQGRCEYCQSRADFATQSFSVEHIIPVSLNGETELENLALACPGCNAHKYNKIRSPDPADGKIVPLYNPRTQQWQEHFRWNHDFSLVVVGAYTDKEINLGKAAELLGIHRLELEEKFRTQGIPLRTGADTSEEVRAEAAAIEQWNAAAE